MKFFKSKLIIGILLVATLLLIAIAILYKPDVEVSELKAKYANRNSKFVEIDGLQVHYRIEGEGEPLVLIHGTGSMLQTWDEWATILSPHFKIIRMDIPAFGLTGPRADGNYSDSMYVQFIEQFTTKIGLDSFYLAGNSLGGLIAWKYAASYPAKVKKLVLIDPAGFHTTDIKGGSFIFKMASKYPTVTAGISKIGTHLLVSKTLHEVFYDDAKITDQKKTMYAELNQRAGNRLAFVKRAQFIHPSNEKELMPITSPTLILWGKEDVLIDEAESVHFKKISNSTLITYEKVGHMPQEEIPEKSAIDAMRFLK